MVLPDGFARGAAREGPQDAQSEATLKAPRIVGAGVGRVEACYTFKHVYIAQVDNFRHKVARPGGSALAVPTRARLSAMALQRSADGFW